MKCRYLNAGLRVAYSNVFDFMMFLSVMHMTQRSQTMQVVSHPCYFIMHGATITERRLLFWPWCDCVLA